MGDPQTRDMTKKDMLGHGRQRQADRRRRDLQDAARTSKGAVAMAHAGDAARPTASSTSRWRRAAARRQYTVFGKVICGMDVVEKIEVDDRIVRVTVKGAK